MYKVNNVNINYINYGNKEGKDIVFLHGWGQNIQMMKPLGDPFAKDYNILIIDLPGHGESEEPEYAWLFREFVECVHLFNP